MKVAFVLAPWYRRESPAPEFAMGIAVLKNKGHEVEVLDINNRIFNNKFLLRKYWRYFLLDAPPEVEKEFFSVAQELYNYYADKILFMNPDVVIFKIIGRTYANAVAIAKIIKQKNNGIKIIFTGALVASKESVEGFMRGQDTSPFDYLICGEDELALPELLRSIETNAPCTLKKNGKVIDITDGPMIDNLDDLPHYDFSDFDLASFRYPEKLEIFISKGCPNRCTFCIDWMTEKKFRAMSGRRIFEEVQYQARLYGTQHFRFCDKTINGDMRAIEEFSDLAIQGEKKYLPLPQWSGDAIIRPEMTIDLLSKMRNAGCVGLGYGLESGSDRVIDDMNKRFTTSLAEEVIRNTHNARIFTSINIMVGFPTESYDDFLKTIHFIERNREFMDEIRLTFIGCRILQYSTLYRCPDKFNLANTDADSWSTNNTGNTYEERTRRFELISQRILDLGIELRVNSRTTKKIAKRE